MSTGVDDLSEFERQTAAVLEAGVQRVNASIRSRLNQARHGALAAAEQRVRRRERLWWNFSLMPAAGALAGAVLVALLLFERPHSRTEPLLPVAETHATAEDLELLADREGLELVEEWDGPFYEWAAEQGDTPTETDG